MVYVRRASLSDMRLVYDLSNDPAIRDVSFNNLPIAWETHIDWFTKALVREDLVFLLGFSDKTMETEFVGQIRYRLAGHQEAEISISLTKDYRNKGIGMEFLVASLGHLSESTAVRRVLAQVKDTNIASGRFFKRCGFTQITSLLSADGSTKLQFELNIN